MSTKHKLAIAMTQKLSALTALDRSGLGDGNVRCEIFSLQEELSYLARIQTPSKAELTRLRAKFSLTESPMPTQPTARTVKVVPPVPSRRIAGAVLRLPAHAPQSFVTAPPQPKELRHPSPIPEVAKVDRLRRMFERYCVHCEGVMVPHDRRFICPNCRPEGYTTQP
jgi:hypothetical protein